MNNRYLFIHMKYNVSFSTLTYTRVSSVKVGINGCSSTDIYRRFRNVCMLNNRTPGISVVHLLRVGVYLSVVFQNVLCPSHWWKPCYWYHPGRMLHIPVLCWWLYTHIFEMCWVYNLVQIYLPVVKKYSQQVQFP